MRFGIALVVWMCCVASAGVAFAHPADEFPQVTVQFEVDDERVGVISRVPAPRAIRLFGGVSPIELDRVEPVDLAKQLQPLLAELCPLSIDGVVVPPTIAKAELRMTGSRLPVRSFSERQALDRGYLVFMAEYETKGKPRRVDVDWNLFANEYDERGEEIHAEADLSLAAMIHGYGKESIALLSPVEPGLTWHSDEAFALPADLLVSNRIQRNFLHVPVLSIGVWLIGLVVVLILLRKSWSKGGVALASCVVAGLLLLPLGQVKLEHTSSVKPPTDAEAFTIFETLHRNIYRAFDYTDEGAVYDALAQSVDGPMLETIYNEVYASLIMRSENGAVSKVVRVEIGEAAVSQVAVDNEKDFGPGAYRVHCSWQVDGVVEHFRHSHARTNAFKAVYTVARRAEGWRIVDAEILQQRRLDDGTLTAEDLVNDS